MAVHDGAGVGELFTQQGMTGGDGIMFVAMNYRDLAAGYIDGEAVLQLLQVFVLSWRPFDSDIVIAPHRIHLSGLGLYGGDDLGASHVPGVNGDITFPDPRGDTLVQMAVGVGEDGDFLNHSLQVP